MGSGVKGFYFFKGKRNANGSNQRERGDDGMAMVGGPEDCSVVFQQVRGDGRLGHRWRDWLYGQDYTITAGKKDYVGTDAGVQTTW